MSSFKDIECQKYNARPAPHQKAVTRNNILPHLYFLQHQGAAVLNIVQQPHIPITMYDSTPNLPNFASID